MLVIVDGNVFKVLTLPNNLVIICRRSWSLVLLTLHDSWKMWVLSAKIWFVKTLTRKVGWHIPVGRSFLKSIFNAHASPHPDPCARVKWFQTKSLVFIMTLGSDVLSALAWLTCLHGWRARVMCQHGWREWCASVGKVGGVLACLARVAC